MQIETDRLLIRSIEEDDFNDYAQLAKEHKFFRRFYVTSEEETKNSYWRMVRSSGDEYFSMFLKITGEFCGSMYLKKPDRKRHWFGIDILSKFQNQNICQEAVGAILKWVKEDREWDYLNLEVGAENAHAKHVFENMGAELIDEKVDPSDMSLEELLQNINNSNDKPYARNRRNYILRV